MIAQNEYSQKVGLRIENERLAVDISACVHELFYNRGVEIVLFRNQLRDKSSSQILELHQYANDFVGKAIPVDRTLEMLKALKRTGIEHAKIGQAVAQRWSGIKIGHFIRIQMTVYWRLDCCSRMWTWKMALCKLCRVHTKDQS